MADEQYFVHVRDPVDIRKHILSSSKQIIQILQRYERIKDLRVKKLEKISQLRATNKEINLIIAKLKKALPAAEMRVKIGGREDKKIKKGRAEFRGDELAKLESDLRMIEEKMGGLS